MKYLLHLIKQHEVGKVQDNLCIILKGIGTLGYEYCHKCQLYYYNINIVHSTVKYINIRANNL